MLTKEHLQALMRGHIYAVQDCYEDFKKLTTVIATKCGVSIP